MGTVNVIVIILAVCCLAVAFYLFKSRQKTQNKKRTKYPNLNSDPECAAENVQSFFNILYIVTSWI